MGFGFRALPIEEEEEGEGERESERERNGESGIGSKDPNNRVVGPEYYNIHGIRALKPSIWVLRPLGFLTQSKSRGPDG